MCHLGLREIPWNRACHLLVCDNVECLAYRTPVRTIPINEVERQRQKEAEKMESRRKSAEGQLRRWRAKKYKGEEVT